MNRKNEQCKTDNNTIDLNILRYIAKSKTEVESSSNLFLLVAPLSFSLLEVGWELVLSDRVSPPRPVPRVLQLE